MVKNVPTNVEDVRDLSSNPGGRGNPLQYSCLWNTMDRGAWWVTVRGVARVGHNLATKLPPPPPPVPEHKRVRFTGPCMC